MVPGVTAALQCCCCCSGRERKGRRAGRAPERDSHLAGHEQIAAFAKCGAVVIARFASNTSRGEKSHVTTGGGIELALGRHRASHASFAKTRIASRTTHEVLDRGAFVKMRAARPKRRRLPRGDFRDDHPHREWLAGSSPTNISQSVRT